MTGKLKTKIVTDAVMTIALLVLMAYIYTGDLAHEIIGTVTIGIWILHHILNRKWYGSFGKGGYPVKRIIGTAVNVLLFFSMAGLIVSSVILSSYLFTFLGIERGINFSRLLHMVTSYWCFVLSAFHLGLHWSRLVKIMQKRVTVRSSRFRTYLLRLIAAAVSVYGLYAFIKHQIGSYMFARMLFVFFDFEKSIFSFLFDYITMLVLFATVSYYIAHLFRKNGALRRRLCSK